MSSIHDLPTPALLVDANALESNLRAMQAACDAGETELWPHCKTHKMVEILRRQLELGAGGATFAKLGEAEALLPSGVRNVFIAHSLVQSHLAERLKALRARVDRLILAVTSEAQLFALERLLKCSGVQAEALLAVDTGLGREGSRTPEAASNLAKAIRQSDALDLIGIYTHEGHGYATAGKTPDVFADDVLRRLLAFRATAGGDLSLWPGCSVTAAALASRPEVAVVRPGSYVFGDLSLAETHGLMPWAQAALTVLTTVVDLPEPGLALIDAGSKTFSSDRSIAGNHGRVRDHFDWRITRLNEEHGYLSYPVDSPSPEIGDRLQIVPAHVCPVVNLSDSVHVIDDETIVATWEIQARGMSQ